MVDTGAAMTLVTEAWAKAHGLKVSEGPAVEVTGAGGAKITIIGNTSMTVQLATGLEVDVTGVTVQQAPFY